MNEAALLTLKASGLIICYPNSETMEITINKIFCLNLYVNPLRNTWYSKTYMRNPKRMELKRPCKADVTNRSSFVMIRFTDLLITGCGYAVLSVRFCSQSERAKYIFFESLELKFLNLSQSERLIDLFISRTEDKFSTLVLSVLQDNKPIESLKNRCISRKTETAIHFEV